MPIRRSSVRASTATVGRNRFIRESVKTFLKKSAIVALDPDTRYETLQDGTIKQLNLPSGVDDSPHIVDEIARGGLTNPQSQTS